MENGGRTFLVVSGEKIESSGKGVRIPFRWNGYSADDVAEIVQDIFEYNYSGGPVISEMMCRANANSAWERAYILDVDGNRYEIPDVEALDRQSYKKIELYL